VRGDQRGDAFGLHHDPQQPHDLLSGLRVELPESARTAATAAAQLGCAVGAIANSLIFSADGGPLLVMTSGAHRVDTAKVAGLAGAGAVTRADARAVRKWTGQAIGGVAPVGHPQPIRTLVDTWLEKYEASGPRPGTRTPSSPRPTRNSSASPPVARPTSAHNPAAGSAPVLASCPSSTSSRSCCATTVPG